MKTLLNDSEEFQAALIYPERARPKRGVSPRWRTVAIIGWIVVGILTALSARGEETSLSTAQCSRGSNQSRPFPARSLKIMESAGHTAPNAAPDGTACEREGTAAAQASASGQRISPTPGKMGSRMDAAQTRTERLNHDELAQEPGASIPARPASLPLSDPTTAPVTGVYPALKLLQAGCPPIFSARRHRGFRFLASTMATNRADYPIWHRIPCVGTTVVV